MELGSTVKFLNENLTGVITKLNKNLVTVMCEDGFERTTTLAELVSYKKTHHQKLKNTKPKVKKSDLINKKGTPVIQKVKEGHIDLHIEELLDDHRNMTNGEIMLLQLRKFEEKMTYAIRNHYDRLIVVHGVGEGVLRSEIHHRLVKKYPYEFMDAPYQEYGRGATLILLKEKRQ